MFSFVCALPSPTSAEGLPPWFGWLTGTTSTVRLLQRVRVRIAACGLRGPALIVRPRRAGDLPVLVHVVSQRARVLRLRRTQQPLAICAAAVLPSSYSEWSRHPDLRAFRSSIAPPTDASVYASRNTSRCNLQDSRSGWIRYFLSCRALASPTTCRFSPALSELPVIHQLKSGSSVGHILVAPFSGTTFLDCRRCARDLPERTICDILRRI